MSALLQSCKPITTNEQDKDKTTLSIPINVSVNDSSLYDPSFIKALGNDQNPIQLIDNYMIIANDTVFFPENLLLNKEYIFEGERDGEKHILSLTRLNMTNLLFDLVSYNKDQEEHFQLSGIAVLNNAFYLAHEFEEDDDSTPFHLNSYLYTIDNFVMDILVGVDLDKNEKQRVKVNTVFLDDNGYATAVEGYPILRTR